MNIKWNSFVGGVTILFFLTLLTIRFGIPEKLISGEERTVTAQKEKIPVGELWMSITQGGKKIGYAQRTYTSSEQGFGFSERIFMRINTMGIVQPLIVRTEAEMKPDHTLSNFRFSLESNLFKFNARGKVSGKNMIVHTGVSDEEKVSVIKLSDSIYLGGGILESVGTAELKEGEKRTFLVFDPASLGQRPVHVILLAEEPLSIMGERLKARKLSVDMMGMKQTAWVDENGSMLREEGMLGIAMERVRKEDALAGLQGEVSADLTEIASIPSSRIIEDVNSLKVLKIRLSGIPEGTFFMDGGRQIYQDGVLTIRREVLTDTSKHLGPPRGDLSDFLKASPFIQSDHPKIRNMAFKIVTHHSDSSVKAEKIFEWVHKSIKKRPVLSVPNALETLKNRIGDCNEHAVLLAALARAAGLPAEVEAGIVYMRGRFFYHAWNVIYLKDRGGWVTADAVLGQLPADVSHIRFVRGEADRQIDLIGLIGRVKLDILEME
ncbi:MAG: transglutaminase domain-containing protein [Deltaproteobacteria bacterium]|nr:transglutaminase domain-containing protein [Deltaproteobacteria bacterium]